MEDASGVDLDWFWRGWFYTTEPVDISMEEVKWYKMDNRSPAERMKENQEVAAKEEEYVTKMYNKQDVPVTVVEANPLARDFYNQYNPFTVSPENEKGFKDFMNRLSPKEKEIFHSDMNYYEIRFKNIGGLVMPLILQFNYTDGTSEIERIPAEIWRLNETEITKVFAKTKQVDNILLDPYRETADIDESNNLWPKKPQPSRFDLFKSTSPARGASVGDNPMKRANK
jgi:hypothetical protein